MSYAKQMVVAAFLVLLLVVGAVNSFGFSLGKYEKVQAKNGIVTLQASKLADGKARFYKYESDGKEISFFAIKASDGSIKTAFDACDACYRSKKGYEQQGDKMKCNNCNQKFAVNRIGPNATDGCNPGYLPNHQSGAMINIKAADLKEGGRYF